MSDHLAGLLSKSAHRRPGACAVVLGKERLTYRQLDLASSRYRGILAERGVRHKDLIGVYLEKTPGAVAAIFGILKNGSCYVPLDPTAPPERLSSIINDAALKYIITSIKKIFHLREILKKTPSVHTLLLIDASRSGFEAQDIRFDDTIGVICGDEISNGYSPHQTDPQDFDGTDPAYILYTSGSTGRPKGVVISHRASLVFIRWALSRIKVRNNDRVSSHAPFHFDLSIFDLFVTIGAGGAVCLVPPGISAFPRTLAEFIENEKISVWYSVPSTLVQLVLNGALEQRDLSNLRLVLFAGEVFPTRYLRALMKIVPRANFYNLYGPTETNVCTYYRLPSPPLSDDPIPIGIPCDGVRSYIVNDKGILAGTGEIGELCISGPTLMNGYLNDHQNTGGVFSINPSLFHTGENVYRTGDFVKLNERGEFEFHGRRDGLIKSRGYRVELGEIESALSLHPEISECAAVGIPDETNGHRIGAVVILKEKASLSARSIQSYCAKKLPPYMVPESIIFCTSLPRTATGKIDRKKLTELL